MISPFFMPPWAEHSDIPSDNESTHRNRMATISLHTVKPYARRAQVYFYMTSQTHTSPRPLFKESIPFKLVQN